MATAPGQRLCRQPQTSSARLTARTTWIRYFNINNSGASNLTLGQNEIQEATVTTNPYAGEFGQLIGSQISYVT